MEQKIYKIKPEEIKEEKRREKDALLWQAQEAPSSPRSYELTVALGIIAIGLLVFGLLTQNYLFVLIVILASLILYMQRQGEPETVNFLVDQEGIHINGKFYPYDSFESFWIFGLEHEHGQELALRNKKRFMPLFLIPLLGVNIDNLRKLLSENLPEKEEKESLIDLLRKSYF